MDERIAQLDTDERWRQRGWWQRTSAFMPLFLIVGLGLPVLSYVLIMVNLGWRAPVLGANGALVPAADAPVYLYASPQTARFLREAGGDYERLLKPWRGYFVERERDYREIADLEALEGKPGSVLVLPSTLALGDPERKRIAAFQAAGGSVLATWATGSRDGSGEWRGWEFMQSLGFYVLGEMPAESQERQLTLIGETPLTTSLQAGLRLWMTHTAESLLRIKGERTAARFTDWRRSSSEGRGEEGAVLYGERANSRAVAFAFSESAWEASPVAVHLLIDDTLSWLQRQPALSLANWPDGRRAAQIVEMDTEHAFANARPFSALLTQAGVAATFFVLTSSAMQHPDVYRELASRHEIAYHGEVHISFKGQPAPEQERRLSAMRAQLDALGGTSTSPILGFRAPTEGYDATTERLLQRIGIRYHVSDPNRGESPLPLFAKMEGVRADDELLVIPRTQRDDINLLEAQTPADAATLLRMLLADLDETAAIGGLGLLSIHSQNFGDGAPLRDAMPRYLASLRARGSDGEVWVASAGEVDRWWRERRKVDVAGVQRGPRVELNITVRGDRTVHGVAVMVALPSRGATAVARGTKVGTTQPRVVPIDPFRSRFVFDALPPGNHSYQINFIDTQP